MSTMIPLACPQCNIDFERQIKFVNRNRKQNLTNFCSLKCAMNMRAILGKTDTVCVECGKCFTRRRSQLKKSKNNFCSQSCSATYNNKHKTHGTRRSKLEIYIENKLKFEFPDILFLSNNKKAIGSELDLYFPDLNLAIEINGPFHYKPIYDKEKLFQIQNNDVLKRDSCINAKY